MQHAYLGVTLHFVNLKNFNLTRLFLGLKELEDSNTGQLILLKTETILSEYNKNLQNISRIVTDNAANMKKAFNTFYSKEEIWEKEIKQIFPLEETSLNFSMNLCCFAHSLQLSIMNFMKEFLAKKDGFKTLCKLIKKSTKATHKNILKKL